MRKKKPLSQATDLWASELGHTLQRIDQDLGRQVLIIILLRIRCSDNAKAQQAWGQNHLGPLNPPLPLRDKNENSFAMFE